MTPQTQPPTNDTALDHALTLAALGLRVLPIRAGTKRPPMNSWQHAATNNPDQIRNWYRGLYRDAGVGIALGPQPAGHNLFALDLDDHNNTGRGIDELHDLERQHGTLPDTWRNITGSGNLHLIYTYPNGHTVRNQQATGNRVAPNIDIRGEGGQIVVAPTTHPDTLQQYAWEHGHEPWTIPPAAAPPWLLELVTEPPSPNPDPPAPSSPVVDTGTVFDQHKHDWNWHTELLNRGWTLCGTNQGDTYWARPGKDRRAGHSAVLHEPDGPLVIFTTEIDPHWHQAGSRTRDGSGWSFSPFGFYAATEHHGNRSAAAQTLADHYQTAAPNLTDLVATTTETAVETPNVDRQAEYDRQLLDMCIDWPAFAETDHMAEEWLWEPVIPAKRAIALFAQGGTGKSLVVLRLVIDIVRNGRKVLYLDYEMTPDDLDDRLSDMGVDPLELHQKLHYALLPSLPAFDTRAGGEAVRRMAQLLDVDLVVIDTFARAVEGDENDADTVRAFYRETGIYLKQDGRGFLRTDHAGKDTKKGQRGSSAKNDDVDLVWELKRIDTGYLMMRGKCRMGWVPDKVKLVRSDGPMMLAVEGGPVRYPDGTVELANELDALGIPLEHGERKVRAAGVTARAEVLRAALKYRRRRTSTSFLVGDLVATQRDNRGGGSTTDSVDAPGDAPLSTDNGRAFWTHRDAPEKPQVNDMDAVRDAPGRTPPSQRDALRPPIGDAAPQTNPKPPLY